MPSSTSRKQNGFDSDRFDVIIVGGGAAGIGAAVGARQSAPNARILIVESQSCLGGAATHRGVVSYCGLFTVDSTPRKAVGAVWEDLRIRLTVVGATREPLRHRGIFQVVDPEGLKFVLDDHMIHYNIDVLLHTPVIGAEQSESDNRIVSIEIQESQGRRRLFAKSFVDCTGDCNLAHLAGASTRYGNHGTVNLGSLATRFGGLPLTMTPTASKWRDAIISAKQQKPELRKLIPKNESVLLRLPISGDVVSFLASASYDARLSSSITKAEVSGRKQAQEYLKILRDLPDHENMHIVSTGPNFGTRESRHINSMYQLTREDITSGRRFDDVIGLGAWGFEFHDPNHENWTSSFQLPPGGNFDVPFGCLRSIDTPNLFAAGRCVDADQFAGSSVRVMGTALVTGQAAGVAAGLVATRDLDGGWDVKDVQECLRENGALLNCLDLPHAPPIKQAA